jgi:hypothetical protein
MKRIAIFTFLFTFFLGGLFSSASAQSDEMRAKSIDAVTAQKATLERTEQAGMRNNTNWMMSEMGVTEEQMDKILAITHTYNDKIAWIQDGYDSIEGKRSKILKLKKLKEQEILTVLTFEQRTQYVQLKEEKKREASAKAEAAARKR